MLVRDGRKQSPPNEAQSVGRVRLGLYSPRLSWESTCWTATTGIYRTQGGSELRVDGARTPPLPMCAVNLSHRHRHEYEDCFGDWGWEGGSDALREEEGAVTECRPLPGSGALSQGQPLPGYLFSIYWGLEKRSPAWVGQPLQPLIPSLPGHSTSSSLFLCHCDSGAGRVAEGPGETRAEGRGGHGGGLGPTGAPQGSLLPTTSVDGCK